MSENPDLPKDEIVPEPEPAKENKPSKTQDFWAGFISSVILNLVLFSLVNGPFVGWLAAHRGSLGYWIVMVFPWVLNIVALILLLVYRRPRIVVGILASYVLLFIIIMCQTASCFG
jgi:hypothetical protein